MNPLVSFIALKRFQVHPLIPLDKASETCHLNSETAAAIKLQGMIHATCKEKKKRNEKPCSVQINDIYVVIPFTFGRR